MLPTVSLKVTAVPMQWMQCTYRLMQYVVTEVAVPMKVDAVPLALSCNVDSGVMQWMQCLTRWMQYVMSEYAVPMNVDAVYIKVYAVC